MGNLPLLASSVAAIRPSVAAGTSSPPMKTPITGICAMTITTVMYMKNRPASASGCRRKVRTPSLIHWKPVRAGTILSFMDDGVAAGGGRGFAAGAPAQ